MDNEISITKVTNGFVLTWLESFTEEYDDVDVDGVLEKVHVIERGENEADSDVIIRVMQYVLDYFGYCYGKITSKGSVNKKEK